MQKRKIRSIFLVLTAVTLSLTLKRECEKFVAPPKIPSLQPIAASYEASALKKYSLGFQNALAGMLWVSLLQSASHDPIKPGEVSWEYAQVDSIITLDPNFGHAYDFGAIFLSVFRRDNLGARIILEKWVKRQPMVWRPHYLLGYHLYFEMHEVKAARKHLSVAASMPGAPSFLGSLAVRLITEEGFFVEALRVSIGLFENSRNPEARFRLKKRMRALRFALSEQAYKDALSSFRKKNRREPEDISELAPYKDVDRGLASIEISEESKKDLFSIFSEPLPFSYDPKSRSIVFLGNRKDFEDNGLFAHLNKKS